MPDPREGDLQVWHIREIGSGRERVRRQVASVPEAVEALSALAAADFRNHSVIWNAQGLEVFEDGEWTDWTNEDGEDIDTVRSKPMAEYYVANKGDEHKGWMDACIVWWRPGGRGYTYDLNEAGIFTDEDRENGGPSPRYCHYIPKDIVDAHCQSPRIAWWSDPHRACGCVVDALKQAQQSGDTEAADA